MTRGGKANERRLAVWVHGWQQECCGQPWTVGSTVSWTLAPAHQDYFAAMFGRQAHVTVDRVEEHHGALPDDAPTTSGTVVAILGVQVTYEKAADHPRSWTPVPGSARVTPLLRSNGEELDWPGFTGYLVELATKPPG